MPESTGPIPNLRDPENKPAGRRIFRPAIAGPDPSGLPRLPNGNHQEKLLGLCTPHRDHRNNVRRTGVEFNFRWVCGGTFYTVPLPAGFMHIHRCINRNRVFDFPSVQPFVFDKGWKILKADIGIRTVFSIGFHARPFASRGHNLVLPKRTCFSTPGRAYQNTYSESCSG